MARKIKEQQGVFVTEASINSSNSGLFQNNMNSIIDFLKKVTINNDKFKHIDIRFQIIDHLNFDKDKLNKSNISNLSDSSEKKEVYYSNTKTSPYHYIPDDLINFDDHVMI